jgi:adenosylcobinamide-GDP ribazoletransferase
MSDKKVLHTKREKTPPVIGSKNIPKIGGLFGLISFSTIIPINIHTSIDEMATFTWFWPIIGGLIGIFVGAVGFLSLNVLHLPSLVSSAIIYSFAIWFTGFHHLDGLMDMGDGLMVHGDYNKKIEVMRDTVVGTGGISLFFIVAIITFSAIYAIPAGLIFLILVISEIAAKTSLVTCATFSKPYKEGTGKAFIESMNIKLLILSFILVFLIGFLALNIIGILGIIGGIIGGSVVAAVASKNFKYATGDILGASNEIGRLVALLVMTAALIYL